MTKIDLNCDMGESFGLYSIGNDQDIMPLITSANIACGFHAGDPQVMRNTVQLAYSLGVAIGAHPGYQDLQGFGRREMTLSADEVETLILYQIGALAAFVKANKHDLIHVKPHGALYNQAARDIVLASSIARAVHKFSPSLILVGLAGSRLVEAGTDLGLHVANEGFPDRLYTPDGSLASRKLPGAVLSSPDAVASQAINLARDGIKVTNGSQNLSIPVDTLCIHGDNPTAVSILQTIKNQFEKLGIRISPLVTA